VKVDLAPQAIIRCKPEELTRSKQIEFEHAEDDLDEYDVAFMRLDPDIRAWQTSHLDACGLYSDIFGLYHAPGPRSANEGSLLLMLHRYRHEPRGILYNIPPQLDARSTERQSCYGSRAKRIGT
jgi:hypothetical protein